MDGHHHHHGHDHSMMGASGDVMSSTTASPASVMGHDHSHHSGHGDHNTMMAGDNSSMNHNSHNMMMHMYFHGGVDETILFEFWKTSEAGGLVLSMIIIFCLSFAYEGLKFYREHLYRHSFQTVQLSTVAVPVENGTVRETHKTVQIGTTSLSNTPYNAAMNPVFLTQTTCTCDASGCAETNSSDKVLNSKSLETNNNNEDRVTNCGDGCTVKTKKVCTPVRGSYKVKILSAIHCWQTILHVIQMVVSYFLMLIFMTYNVWLCIAVALGAGAGYFCFGWKKSVVVDVTEHCH